MGRIVVFENVSLDGVVQDPTGDEGFNRSGDWRAALTPDGRREWDKLVLDDALGAQALLLGRRSYEFFAARYPFRTGALADRMNILPKYVVSASLDQADAWNNSTVLKGDVVSAASTLKQKVNGEIRVYASSRLVHTLIEHDLVDELRLTVFPLAMGVGDRLFGQTSKPKPLRLVQHRTIAASLTYLTYQCIPDIERSTECGAP